MSGNTDPFLVLVDDIGALRRQIENLQRTSLDRDEAEHLNATIAKSLDNMAQTGKRLEQRLEGQQQLATAKTNRAAIEAAQDAARGAIRESHAEILQTARSLSQAAGEARREAWRWFGGFWVWLTSIGAAGALIGALAAFWITGRGDAKAFGQHPRIYCLSAGGEFADQRDGSRYCIFMVSPPTQPAGE
jgi:nucleoside diphosphate kinase